MGLLLAVWSAPAPAQVDGPDQRAESRDLAAQVENLRDEIEQLKLQFARLTAVVEELKTRQASPAPSSDTVPPPATAKGRPNPQSKQAAVAPMEPAAREQPAPEPPPSTVFVFHNRRRVEARNYAIVGETLWLYTETESMRFPLSELDVDATTSTNADRGVRFQLPPGR